MTNSISKDCPEHVSHGASSNLTLKVYYSQLTRKMNKMNAPMASKASNIVMSWMYVIII